MSTFIWRRILSTKHTLLKSVVVYIWVVYNYKSHSQLQLSWSKALHFGNKSLIAILLSLIAGNQLPGFDFLTPHNNVLIREIKTPRYGFLLLLRGVHVDRYLGSVHVSCTPRFLRVPGSPLRLLPVLSDAVAKSSGWMSLGYRCIASPHMSLSRIFI